MGIAIAREAARRGAKVILVLGPVVNAEGLDDINVINVISAAEMAKETIDRFTSCDIAILTAAVADYTPVHTSGSKLKKSDSDLILKLKPTTDIAATLGGMKKAGQLLVGFALETDNEKKNAGDKLKKKKMDLIVLNSLRNKGAGFAYDTNKITLIDRDNNIQDFKLKSKTGAAADILDKIESLL